MGFLCQAGAMNSFGDAALFVLLRIYVYTLPLVIFFLPPKLEFSLRQTANCPQVSLTHHTHHLGGFWVEHFDTTDFQYKSVLPILAKKIN